MTIEIHEPALEQQIQQLMETGAYSSVEDLVGSAIKTAALHVETTAPLPKKQSLGEFLRNSPLWGSDLQIPPRSGAPRIPKL